MRSKKIFLFRIRCGQLRIHVSQYTEDYNIENAIVFIVYSFIVTYIFIATILIIHQI